MFFEKFSLILRSEDYFWNGILAFCIDAKKKKYKTNKHTKNSESCVAGDEKPMQEQVKYSFSLENEYIFPKYVELSHKNSNNMQPEYICQFHTEHDFMQCTDSMC